MYDLDVAQITNIEGSYEAIRAENNGDFEKTVLKLIEDGYTGRKGKGGFFRINKSSDVKVLESLNYKDNTYHESKKVDLGLPDVMDVKTVIEREDAVSYTHLTLPTKA